MTESRALVPELWKTRHVLLRELDALAAELRAVRADKDRIRASLAALRDRAPRSPIDVDISDYSDIYCLGFLAGQTNALDAALAASAAPGEDA